MFDLFDFDLPGAVTEQLEKKLRAMPSSPLTENALRELSAFQQQHRFNQGVYQLLLGKEVVYIGKATDAAQRLRQHWEKVRCRRNLKMSEVRFRCLLLHPNWSTSANEELLIAHYKQQGQCKWNRAGFGPKDVGAGRDDTQPNWFDRTYPINEAWRCTGVEDRETVGSLLRKLKTQLPFTFRYKVGRPEANKVLDLAGIPRTARDLIAHVVAALGSGWQATLFKSHIILYKEARRYTHGVILKN
jgi:predicted GIY-YIG superfamily endonuclease